MSIIRLLLLLHNALLLVSLNLIYNYSSVTAVSHPPPAADSPAENLPPAPHDALALLAFKSKADLRGKLAFSSNTSLDYCKWQGLQCVQGKAIRVVLQGLSLEGVFGEGTLSRLDQLRVLSLQNNSLTGPIPDLSGLFNLKSLFLDHNSFNASVPPSVSTLHRLRTLDLSYNNLTGPIPLSLTNLDRLYYFRLDSNRLNGSIPPLNQSSLQVFNVSRNNLTGAVPVTPTLLHFGTSSFSWNPGLCGQVVNKECNSQVPFFGPVSVPAAPPVAAIGQNEQIEQGGVELDPPSGAKKHKRTTVIVGFSLAVLILIGSILCFAIAINKQKQKKKKQQPKIPPTIASDSAAASHAAVVMRMEEENELEEKVKKVQVMQVAKSGSLVFCAGEAQLYTLDQLMRASAELLGKGTIGTTYKAVLDNRLIVSVKRLDAGKLAGTSKDEFERHMESVGGLRHPNLVPLRAYFQAKEERLLVYDYHPNGSLFSLIHDPPELTMYKNRLQEYTKKSSIPLPVYETINEGGVPHEPRFRSTVRVDGASYTSRDVIPQRKAAEQDVARVALDDITQKILIREETVFCKSILHEFPVFCKSILSEYAVKMHLDKPTYNTTRLLVVVVP